MKKLLLLPAIVAALTLTAVAARQQPVKTDAAWLQPVETDPGGAQTYVIKNKGKQMQVIVVPLGGKPRHWTEEQLKKAMSKYK